jgi:DNA polymerase-3 subunit epsilon
MFQCLHNLTLQRPLCVLHLEATGINPARDRIVELALLRIEPDGAMREHAVRINPEIPISEGATAMHGITDPMVAGCPTFKQISLQLLRDLKGCDLAGFNLKRFDLLLLVSEFARVGLWFSLRERGVIDVLELYHVQEPRNLASAVRSYLGHCEEHSDTARGRARATAAVLDAQLGHYLDLPREVQSLHDLFASVPIGRRMRQMAGGSVFACGKYAGRYVDEVRRLDPLYLTWMLRGDYFDSTKSLTEWAPAGQFEAEPR